MVGQSMPYYAMHNIFGLPGSTVSAAALVSVPGGLKPTKSLCKNEAANVLKHTLANSAEGQQDRAA